jgi:hypothetical protein
MSGVKSRFDRSLLFFDYFLPLVFVVASCSSLRWERRACRTCRAIANEAQSSAIKASIEMQKRTRMSLPKDNKAGGEKPISRSTCPFWNSPVDKSGSFHSLPSQTQARMRDTSSERSARRPSNEARSCEPRHPKPSSPSNCQSSPEPRRTASTCGAAAGLPSRRPFWRS